MNKSIEDLAPVAEAVIAGLPSVDELKASYRSGEFWLSTLTTVAGLVITALAGAGILGAASPIVLVGGILAASLPTVVHTWQRSKLKGIVAVARVGLDIRTALKAGELARLKQAPYSSLSPPVTEPSVVNVNQTVTVDEDNPKHGKGDEKFIK